MADIFKLILLLTLSTLCFLPQDGAGAAVKCRCQGGPECMGDKDENRVQECDTGTCFIVGIFTKAGSGEPDQFRYGCGDSGVKGSQCAPIPDTEEGVECTCSTPMCNSNLQTAGLQIATRPPSPLGITRAGSCRVHGSISYVLISVLVLLIPVPFIRTP